MGPTKEYDLHFKIYPETEKDINDETNPALKFLEMILETAESIYEKYISQVKPMRELTPLEKEKFNSDKTCHICKKAIINEKHKHCHITSTTWRII